MSRDPAPYNRARPRPPGKHTHAGSAKADGRFDVVGIGNAIVDVIAHADDGLIAELGLDKGIMTLVDEPRIDELYRRMGPAREMSGGSCANSMAAVAALGGRAAYIGRVRDDQLGEVFAHDMRASGVVYRNAPSPSGPATARCLIFVTPDAQRTMQTYLGACVELAPEDVDEDARGPAPPSPISRAICGTGRGPRPPAARRPRSPTRPAAVSPSPSPTPSASTAGGPSSAS